MLSLFVNPGYQRMYEERKLAERAAAHKPIPPGDMSEVLREQLDSLIEHVEGHCGHCVCATCERYWRVRLILTEVFGEPARAMGAG